LGDGCDVARDCAGVLKASGSGTGATEVEVAMAGKEAVFEEDKEKVKWLSLTTFLSHLAK
jgi:hypothetical protein